MDIAFHIGAHETDGDRLIKCAVKNRELLQETGTAVPNPARYRKLLREALQGIVSGGDPSARRAEVQEVILPAGPATRVALSNANFCGINTQVFEHNQFYPLAPVRAAALAQLFPDDQLQFHLGIRNPATFVPAVLRELEQDVRNRITVELDPFDLRWSDVITRMKEACPQAQFTVWCNEDTPVLWSQIVRELSGLDHVQTIAGEFDLLAEIMTQEGFTRFRSYLESHPPQTEVQKRRVIVAFLDKFALPEALEEELDMPGWTDETVEALSDIYEEDLYTIERLHGVTTITP